MSWYQKEFTLDSRSRGVYLVTDEVVAKLPEIAKYKMGILHLFVKHSSCSICLNENYDPTARADMNMMLDKIVPESGPKYSHTLEGPDDSPAHVKACLVGSSVTIPISNGKLNLGTWQGIWFCEHRNAKHNRSFVATINGQQ